MTAGWRSALSYTRSVIPCMIIMQENNKGTQISVQDSSKERSDRESMKISKMLAIITSNYA